MLQVRSRPPLAVVSVDGGKRYRATIVHLYFAFTTDLKVGTAGKDQDKKNHNHDHFLLFPSNPFLPFPQKTKLARS